MESGQEPGTSAEITDPVAASPSIGLLWRVWLGLGMQSFGGGVATLALIRQAVIDRHKWVAEEDFTRDWALVQIAPGINLLALTILIGRRLRGVQGIAIALTGLLLPSVTLTILLTAGYARIQGLTAVQAALHGILPAIVGLGLLTSVQMSQALLKASRGEGRSSLIVSVLILLGSGLATALWHLPVMLVLLLAGGAGALWQWGQAAQKRKRESASA